MTGTMILASLLLAGAAEPAPVVKGDESKFVRVLWSLFVDCVSDSVTKQIVAEQIAESHGSASAIADAAFAVCREDAELYGYNLQAHLNSKYDPQHFSVAARDEAKAIYQARMQTLYRGLVNGIPGIQKLKAK